MNRSLASHNPIVKVRSQGDVYPVRCITLTVMELNIN